MAMASSLMTRAKNELSRMNDRAKRVRAKAKEEQGKMTAGASVLAGAALAAIVDEKFAGNTDQAEMFGMPTTALLGGGAVITAALVKGVPFRNEIAAAGLGMASTALYQLIRENVEFEQSEA